MAPSGEFLASVNTRKPEDVVAMLGRAMEKWRSLGDEQRRPPPEAGAAAPRRWEDRRPADGLVLEVFSRDVFRDLPAGDWRSRAWNQDYAWFTREEARSLPPADLGAGAEQAWPDALIHRLARCHLVDNVRGQTPAFPADSVREAALRTRVASLAGGRVEVAFEGRTVTRREGRWPVNGFADSAEPAAQVHGCDVRLRGRAVFDPGAGRFSSFELIAFGTRTGGTQFNGRTGDLEPAPIGFVLRLAGDAPADRVAPALIGAYGWR